MKTYAINNHLPSLVELIEEVEQGEEIVFTDHGLAVAKIIPFSFSEKPETAKPGIWKNLPGGLWMSKDFDEPLDDFKDYMG